MNKFLNASVAAIARNGLDMTYTSKVKVVDPIKGTAVVTSTDYILKIYPRHTQATQYNLPALIGKDVVLFYIANNSLPFTPSIADSITYNGTTYRINSYQEHVARGEICMFRVVGVKG